MRTSTALSPRTANGQKGRELLPWRLGHGRRMMIHDHPILPLLYVGETVSGGQGLGFAVSDEGEGVVPGIDRSATVNTDQLLSKSNLQPRKRFEGVDKVFAQRRRIGTHRRRNRSPKNGILRIKGSTLSGSFSPSAPA